jgi:hypothetical protein
MHVPSGWKQEPTMASKNNPMTVVFIILDNKMDNKTFP